jgi:coenzyme F420 hydrogenase subunit beta
LQVKDDHVKRLYDCAGSLDLCPICNEVCPHSQALLLRSAEAVSDAPVRSEAVGYFRRILLAQANDLSIREKGADGAVVSSLLTYGLNSKAFDSTVITGTDENSSIQPKSQVALTIKEATSAGGSKFFSSPVVKAYRNAVLEYGKNKIAVVATPCQVLALRKIDAWGHKIGGKAKITIGLFCYGTLQAKPFASYLENKFGISIQDITGMQLSNGLIVYSKKGTFEVPLAEAKMLTNLGCKTCIDYTSELADISVGTAYPLKEWSTVILRTKAGEDFFNSAVQKGAVNTRSIEGEPEVFEHLIVAALKKRTSGLIKASKLEKKLNYVPIRLIRESEALAAVKVEDIMTKEVISIPSNMPVSTLLSIMATKTYIGYPVINQYNELEASSPWKKRQKWTKQHGGRRRSAALQDQTWMSATPEKQRLTHLGK